LAILFRTFCFIASKHLKIIRLSNLSTLSVPDEGYSRNESCALNLISKSWSWSYGSSIYNYLCNQYISPL